MNQASPPNNLDGSLSSGLSRDIVASVVVFLVALPLCLGIALASGAPLFSGVLAGIIGGVVVGSISGSHTSVSGPAAGLAAIVAAQLATLGSFEAFLLAVLLAGVLQIGLGIAKAGTLSAFFPSSVIKGLLAAIGVLLILKQIPHVLGHDTDPEGEMSFSQPDSENTFSEILTVLAGDIHVGAAVIGIASILVLVLWNRTERLKSSILPGPLVVVLFGVFMQALFKQFGGRWVIQASHLVQIPVAETLRGVVDFLAFPDFSQWTNPAIYVGAFTIAIVASLETLLNLDAVDKLDPERRDSPPSRELIAQGVGNVIAGLIGGIPITSVIVRSSVNVGVGAKSKLSAIFHGILLAVCVVLFPVYLNMIPLAALAAILLVTGFKLASPSLFRAMWSEGRYQFSPFIATLVSIVFTDLLIGILIGLVVSILFILNSNLRRPIPKIVEPHADGDLLRIELSNQVSFLNRASLDKLFSEVEQGSTLLIDASHTDYLDPDVLSLIRDFKENRGPAHGVSVRLHGFRREFGLQDDLRSSGDSPAGLRHPDTPDMALEVLREGNWRFRTGNSPRHHFRQHRDAASMAQTPFAVVLSCADLPDPPELVFDAGSGEIFSVRVAGNVVGNMSLGSIEHSVAAGNLKLVLVLGHTACDAIRSSIRQLGSHQDADKGAGCQHFQSIASEIAACIEPSEVADLAKLSTEDRSALADTIASRNVRRTVHAIADQSDIIRRAVDDGDARLVGALYDVATGRVEFLDAVQDASAVGP